MLTWNAAAPPALPPLTWPQRARGGLRLAAAVAVTALALAAFLPGRALRRGVSPRVGFHFAVAQVWARAMLALMGVSLRVRGAPMAGAGVVVANHASWADILALRATRRLNFVSKAEVRAWPGVGWIAAVTDTVFIERRRAAAGRQRDELLARLAAGEVLCLFPEGTSSDGLRVLPFKSALLEAVCAAAAPGGLGVQPATVNWIAPPGLPREFFGWWGSMGFETHIWDVLCRSRGAAVEVVLHEPVAVAAFANRKALARHCEERVRAGKRELQPAPDRAEGVGAAAQPSAAR